MAIFPFQNLASDASLDWLGVGIAETLTGDLRNLDAVSLVTPDVVLRAIPREPSYDIRAVGQKLRADLIVTGSFQRVEDQMRIMSRVLDVPTGEILFTSKLNGEWSHIFDLQDRVVTELLSGLRFKASSSEVAPILSPDTIHLEAYEQYAEGKRLFHRPGRSNLDEAKQRFERALALDPGNAAAHGGLGATFAMLYIRRTDPDDLLRALTHLQRALQLDAELSQPYPFLAYARWRQGKIELAREVGKEAVRRLESYYFLSCI